MAPIGTVLNEKAVLSPITKNNVNSVESGDCVINIDSSLPSKSNTGLNTESHQSSEAENNTLPHDDVKHTITKSLEEFPAGYPRVAAFQSSEPSFSLYRCFAYLHSRVLLELQDELVVLESNLADLDEDHAEIDDGRRLKSRAIDLRQSRKEGVECERRSMIATIRNKLVNYDEILVKARELNAFQRPSSRDYRSVRNWFWSEGALVEAEEEFIRRKEDIISLRIGREWAGFDGLVERLLRKVECRLIRKIFRTPELRAKSKDKDIYYYSASRIEKFVGIIITIVIFILLVSPVVAMYRLTSIGKRNSTFAAIGVLVVFTMLFSASMSLMTKARRHELFAASAAYCAVLVVFISNFNNNAPLQDGISKIQVN
ncbi:hypothetical protein K432DRAFT_449138 [Lepidopterella palustris CBS 459.81]|uniref:DUF6594 domain-containing protein n=1 Tax=Lepidopterella palustris CBS 459.81 TaxID=1314670 RepID=A0A8E2J8I6_9PEZI|nr:hypothetical protein K432DRAFT_449138 [Lepidopterella palustris CBS 459.81]